MGTPMTSLQRALTSLGHREPDRVPLFLTLTLHGAKELGIPIREYFSRPRNVVEGQLRLRRKFRSDFIYALHYASIEVEAWGGETIFFDDGPPNAGEPFIRTSTDIDALEPPRIGGSPALGRVLESIRELKARVDDAPIIGVVMSPFSVPVMQMGFDRYLDLIHEEPDRFERLMRVNEAFCIEWANAQIHAGATAIGYFDPVSSSTIIPPELYARTGLPIAKRTLAGFAGPGAIHFASGRCLPILDKIITTGTAMVGVSALEDLAEIKNICAGKIAVAGNLNGITMRNWSAARAEDAVREAIAKAGRGGGFILSDNHGEIPWQVPDEVLVAIGDAVERWGTYPLDWIP